MRLTIYVCTSTKTYVYIYTQTIDYIISTTIKKYTCQLPLEAASAFSGAAGFGCGPENMC
jgi:hypothetical protein